MGSGTEDPGTDAYFVPFGIILALAIGYATYRGWLGPAYFWYVEAGGYLLTAVMIGGLPKKKREPFDYLFVVLTILGGLVWVLHAYQS